MADTQLTALISLYPRYADALLSGEKCVELRRRRPRFPSGTKLWFYSKMPVARVVGAGTVKHVQTDDLDAIWERYSHCAALSRSDFDDYLSGSSFCSVISFADVSAATSPLSLAELRVDVPEFHPPQFFRWIGDGALHDALARVSLQRPIVSCDH